jgi:hypothetical protein
VSGRPCKPKAVRPRARSRGCRLCFGRTPRLTALGFSKRPRKAYGKPVVHKRPDRPTLAEVTLADLSSDE